MEDVLKVLGPNYAEFHKNISHIPILSHITEPLITAINTSTKYNLKNDHRSSSIGSFVSPDFVLKEELLHLVALQESTHGVNIRNALDSIMKTSDLSSNKLVSISTIRGQCNTG